MQKKGLDDNKGNVLYAITCGSVIMIIIIVTVIMNYDLYTRNFNLASILYDVLLVIAIIIFTFKATKS